MEGEKLLEYRIKCLRGVIEEAPVCAVCGNKLLSSITVKVADELGIDIGYEYKCCYSVQHHLSYDNPETDETVWACGTCHTKIHREEVCPELKPDKKRPDDYNYHPENSWSKHISLSFRCPFCKGSVTLHGHDINWDGDLYCDFCGVDLSNLAKKYIQKKHKEFYEELKKDMRSFSISDKEEENMD